VMAIEAYDNCEEDKTVDSDELDDFTIQEF
jgi:hypothetical protein